MLVRYVVFVVAALLAVASSVEAAPTLALSTSTAAPGVAVSAMITGTPGQRWALIGSTVNSGFSFAGVALRVGADVRILAMGTLDGSGAVVVPVLPPFVGTTLDRYYLQAATSPSPSYAPLEASSGAVIRNGDLVVPGPPGPAGLSGIIYINGSGTVMAGSSGGGGSAACPEGKVVIGGGGGGGNVTLRLYSSFPNGNTWFVAMRTFDNQNMASTVYFSVYAICATVSP